MWTALFAGARLITILFEFVFVCVVHDAKDCRRERVGEVILEANMEDNSQDQREELVLDLFHTPTRSNAKTFLLLGMPIPMTCQTTAHA